MKKLCLAVLTLMLVSAPVLAAEKSAEGNWYFGVGGGIDVPTQNWHPAYNLGGGGSVRGGYNFDKNWGLQLSVENMYFEGTINGTSTSVFNPRPVLAGKFTADTKDIQPYLFVGPALDILVSSAGGTSTTDTNFGAEGGAGVQLNLDQQTDLFLEGKYAMVFLSNAATSTIEDMPVELGVNFGF